MKWYILAAISSLLLESSASHTGAANPHAHVASSGTRTGPPDGLTHPLPPAERPLVRWLLLASGSFALFCTVIAFGCGAPGIKPDRTPRPSLRRRNIATRTRTQDNDAGHVSSR